MMALLTKEAPSPQSPRHWGGVGGVWGCVWANPFAQGWSGSHPAPSDDEEEGEEEGDGDEDEEEDSGRFQRKGKWYKENK